MTTIDVTASAQAQPRQFAWKTMLQPGMLVPGLILVIALAWAIAPGLFTSVNPTETVGPALQGPNAQFWFGTDATGRDLFARVVHGASE